MGVTLKVLRRGTHRSASLDDTLSRVLRLAPVMGITRVANVTGLDSVGIPVVMVSGRNSRSVAVSQGKGIDLASARASGLMEATELYHAKTITQPLRLAAYEELRYQHNIVQIDDLPRGFDSRFTHGQRSSANSSPRTPCRSRCATESFTSASCNRHCTTSSNKSLSPKSCEN
jgi:Uncharacterized conserved protein